MQPHTRANNTKLNVHTLKRAANRDLRRMKAAARNGKLVYSLGNRNVFRLHLNHESREGFCPILHDKKTLRHVKISTLFSTHTRHGIAEIRLHDLCKYIMSDSQLLIYKITLDYLLLGTGRRGGGGNGVWRLGKREIIYTYRYTDTTRMIPALRWATIKALLMFQ